MAIRLRAGNVADVETFAQLVNAQHQWLRGENLWDVDELASILVSPSSDPVRYDRYLEVDGSTVAGVHTHVSEPFSRASLYLASPPVPGRIDYARQLLEAGQRLLRSREEIPSHATVQVDVPQEDGELCRLLITMGFVHTDDMVILESDLSKSSPPTVPSGITLKTFDISTDLEPAYEVMQLSFMPEPGGWHVSRDDFWYMLANDPTAIAGLTVLAMEGHKPVGIAVNFADTTKEQTGLVGMLGVVPEMRRRGVGHALLADSCQRFRQQGWSHARLATIVGHRSSDLSFFQSAQMEPIFVNQTYVKQVH